MLDNDILLNFLTECGFTCSSIDLLDGYHIHRDTLLDIERYKRAKLYIPELKKSFSSSSLTALHISAENKQQWPLINIVRQVLKSCNYRFQPKRISNGYTASGKKLYKRIFEVQQLKTVQD